MQANAASAALLPSSQLFSEDESEDEDDNKNKTPATLPPQIWTQTGRHDTPAIQIALSRPESELTSSQINPIHSLPPAATTPSSSTQQADEGPSVAMPSIDSPSAEIDHAPAVVAQPPTSSSTSTFDNDLENHSTSKPQTELMDNVQIIRSEPSARRASLPLDQTSISEARAFGSEAPFALAQWQRLQLQMLTELQNSTRTSQGHQAFLRNRQEASQQLSALIELQMTLLAQSLASDAKDPQGDAQTREQEDTKTWEERQISIPEPSSLTQMPANEALSTDKGVASTAAKTPADEPLTASESAVSEPSSLPAAETRARGDAGAQILIKEASAKGPLSPEGRIKSAVPKPNPPESPSRDARQNMIPASPLRSTNPTLPQAPTSTQMPKAMVDPLLVQSAGRSQDKEVIWDEADLLEFAQGKIGNVFGPEYSIIDNYSRRVRLPTPPYLLVSRVTKLSATRGRFEPCSLTTEYDIPHDGWYLVDGQIPWAVAVESGQCDLLLISYLGIDFECKGERVYRLLDATLTFLDKIPMAGDTLRYDISINSYARSGPSLLFFFSYNCYVGDKMVLKMRNGCAGFFTDQELAQGQGVIFSDSEQEEFRNVQPQHFEPLLKSSKHAFEHADLVLSSEGKIAECFGAAYDQGGLNPSLRLPPSAMLMMDRIVSIDPHGGRWGLGLVMAEKDLAPDHWYFPCHFMDDQVLAGSLMADGCTQLMQFYMLYLGMQTQTVDARFHPLNDLPQTVRCRGQVTPINRKMTYKMEITEIGFNPDPYAKANVSIMVDGKFSVYFKDLGLVLLEKTPDDPFKMQIEAATAGKRDDVSSSGLSAAPQADPTAGVPLYGINNQPITVRKPALFDETHIEAFAKESVVDCFGDEYAIYADRRTPRTPNGPLKLVRRITEINGQRHQFNASSSLVSEYDMPTDAWFYQENNYPTTPYSIIMEIALQPCGFLSAYLGSTLPYPEIDFYFRNLDGQGHLLKLDNTRLDRNGVIDLRGKTITNRVRLLSSTAIQGIVIQKFDYEMLADGDLFYKGDAVFGYFTKEALSDQVGLDNGKFVPPWHLSEANIESAIRLDLRSPEIQHLYHAQAGKPHYRLANPLEKLNLLDEVLIVPGGGLHQEGYVYAERAIDPNDWFFSAHFYQDPVMPGSLGIEAMLQAMQAYALQLDLASQFQSPYFEQVADHKISWKYRGEIPHTKLRMRLEIHLTRIEQSAERVTLYGDASLWREELRIYEVKQIALNILESQT